MAIQTATMATFDAYLHEWYIEKKQLIIGDAYENKLLTAIPKGLDASGKNWVVTVPAEQVNGRGATYATAKANGTAGSDLGFTGLWKNAYGFVSLDDKVLQLSKRNGAVDEAEVTKLKSCRDNFMAGTNFQLYRTEDGDVGRLAAFGGNQTVATGTLSTNTLEAASQRLKVNTVLQFSSARGGTVRAGTWKVVNIQDNGVLGLQDAATSGSDAPVAGDYVYIAGDARNNASSTTLENGTLAGFEAWVPSTQAVASADFKGVARGSYGSRANGIRLDASSKRMSEAISAASIKGKQYGGRMSHVFTHPTRFAELSAELQGQQRYTTVAGRAGIKLTKAEAERFGFPALTYGLGGGDVMIIDDWACQYAFSWAVQLDSWKLVSAGAFPRNRGEGTDGLKMLRADGTNYVFELVGYGEVHCTAPGRNVVIVHSTAA